MASKRPIVVGGNTPGKPASKRSSTEGTSRKSLLQEGNEGQVGKIQNVCFYRQRVSELSEIIMLQNSACFLT